MKEDLGYSYSTVMNEATPKISMQRSARYVTQSAVYDSPRLGPLTDRRIAFYIKRGYYGEAEKRRMEEREKARRKKILIEFVV